MTSTRKRSCCKPAPDNGPIVSGGGKRSQLEGRVCWWRWSGLSEGERGERSQVEGSGLRCGEAVSGVGERSPVEESSLRWRGAIAGGGERSQVEASGLRLRGAVAGGGERSQVEGRGLRWRGAVSGGGERTPVGRVPSKRHPG